MGARTILHVDMDAFYASVEQRDDPALRGKPVVVGGASRRGVVAAASYEVRPYGVRSAMPMAEALRRCPHAIVVPPRMDRYSAVSRDVFGVFHRYTPLVEGLSLDEAFLDVTASRALFGDGEAIARRIKHDIKTELRLTASAGVAPCKFAAKIASDMDKPDGLVVVREEDLQTFLAPLSIDRMWGVGPKTAERLRARGFSTFRDLAEAPVDDLVEVLGRAGALHVGPLARGDDSRPVVPGRAAESVGAEETYEYDLARREDKERALLELAERVAQRLIASELATSRVTLKIKYADFSLKTRALTLPEPVADTQSLFDAAKVLLDRVPTRPARLLGISVAALASESGAGSGSLPLFPSEDALKRRRVEAVVAEVGARFGRDVITRAGALGQRGDKTAPQRRNR